MPELPEVETVVRALRPNLVGRTIRSVTVGELPLRGRWDPAWGPAVVGSKVGPITRRGKWIIADLGDGKRLVLHLGMTGHLSVVPGREPAADHTHVRIGLGGRSRDELRFRDPRRFGGIIFFADEAALQDFLTERLGPEPFDMKPAAWRTALGNTRRSLKAALLDQRLIAGVGNIYADESLFSARLFPERIASEVSPAEAERLRKAIVRILTMAIERRGSSIRDYAGGGYQNEFRVYGRTGMPCPRCKTLIAVCRLAGRSTHYCPRCQNSENHGSHGSHG